MTATAGTARPATARRRWPIAVITAATTVIAGTTALVAAHSAEAATIDTSATYVFVNRHSGKAMDVYNWATNDGAAINQFARNDLAVQQWQFVSAGSGYYKIRSRHSGKVLDLPDANDGTQLVQYADNGSTRQQFQVLDSSDGYVRFKNRASGKVLDVWEWSTADGAKIAQFTDLDGWNQQWQLAKLGGTSTPQTGLAGWATQNGGTTGGGSASATTVSSASALTSALSSSSASVIRVSGTISCSGMLKVASNKTVLGNAGATIVGCGFTLSGSKNVIIRNLTFRDWNDDAVNVEQSSTNVWIDHNTFSNGYDGAVDIKRGSDFITVSWNRVFNHDKSMLLGHSDDNGSQDRGHLRVTYHHNWFDGSTQRHPRVRFGNPVHVYNNYYNNVGGYGVASTEGAGVLVEGNYFENTDDRYHLGEGDSGPGTLVARNNHFVNSGSGQTGGSVASIPYSYTLETASNVKASVTAGAGAGRVSV
ncbi:RICIN domain-containing protein [Dactylosporangium sp. NPDC005572]|uniref:pectate lyase family protein n=1 Tax=Dactylosporangium sp. NPDC005572 TaxID=3156889 RepID=UPI0033BCD3C0